MVRAHKRSYLLYGPHRRVEIRHPVYALLFQNLVVLSAMELALAIFSISGLALGFSFREVRLEYLAFLAEVQFHEVTWACTSFLRLVKGFF